MCVCVYEVLHIRGHYKPSSSNQLEVTNALQNTGRKSEALFCLDRL